MKKLFEEVKEILIFLLGVAIFITIFAIGSTIFVPILFIGSTIWLIIQILKHYNDK